eukprot:3389418-Prymnesium_polylepis.1
MVCGRQGALRVIRRPRRRGPAAIWREHDRPPLDRVRSARRALLPLWRAAREQRRVARVGRGRAPGSHARRAARARVVARHARLAAPAGGDAQARRRRAVRPLLLRRRGLCGAHRHVVRRRRVRSLGRQVCASPPRADEPRLEADVAEGGGRGGRALRLALAPPRRRRQPQSGGGA